MDFLGFPETGKVRASKVPYSVQLEAGLVYYFCACGRSRRQPFCDGLHTGSGVGPKEFSVEETKEYSLCGCKETGNAPFCDGQHARLEW